MEGIPPEVWAALLKGGSPVIAVALAAFFSVKGSFNGLKADVKDSKKALFGDPTAVPPTPGLVALVTKLCEMSEAKTEQEKIAAEVERRLKLEGK